MIALGNIRPGKHIGTPGFVLIDGAGTRYRCCVSVYAAHREWGDSNNYKTHVSHETCVLFPKVER